MRYTVISPIPCETQGCMGPAHASAFTALTRFCIHCWRRHRIVQYWIDQYSLDFFLATGEEKERLASDRKDLLHFIRTASNEAILFAYSSSHLDNYPFDSFHRTSDLSHQDAFSWRPEACERVFVLYET